MQALRIPMRGFWRAATPGAKEQPCASRSHCNSGFSSRSGPAGTDQDIRARPQVAIRILGPIRGGARTGAIRVGAGKDGHRQGGPGTRRASEPNGCQRFAGKYGAEFAGRSSAGPSTRTNGERGAGGEGCYPLGVKRTCRSGLGTSPGVGAVLPNPSFESRPNGKPPGPGRWYAVHFHRPGPGGLPSAPPQLER